MTQPVAGVKEVPRPSAPARIVVGVDGSADSVLAVQWALDVAERRGVDLEVLSVLPELAAVSPWGALGVDQDANEQALPTARRQVRAQVDEVLAARGATFPFKVVTTSRSGDPVDVLADSSGPDVQLVVGSRGLGGFGRLLLGSVSDGVVRHARGPVTIVRPSANPDGPIVVGVDGSASSEAALAYAVHRARETGASLHVLYAWAAFDGPWPPHEPGIVPPIDEFEQAAARELELFTAGVLPAQGVDAVQRLVHGAPAHALVAAAATAAEVVVGARGRGGFAGLALGSTSTQLIRHAGCTSTVVRAAG